GRTLPALVEHLNLPVETLVDIRTFLQATTHFASPLLLHLPVTLAHPATDNQLRAWLVLVTRTAALRRGALTVHRSAAALRTTLTTTKGVSIVAHRHTANLRTATQVPAHTGLAQATVLVVGVTDLTD